jgi:NADPH-dependent 2,4-dienoyl-CoA reductase/sulfur reductase-like enzyme
VILSDARDEHPSDRDAPCTRIEGVNGAEGPEPCPRGHCYTPDEKGQGWTEHQRIRREFIDSEPEVLVVGSGQAGLIVAANLERLGVRAVVMDKNERVYSRYLDLNVWTSTSFEGAVRDESFHVLSRSSRGFHAIHRTPM